MFNYNLICLHNLFVLTLFSISTDGDKSSKVGKDARHIHEILLKLKIVTTTLVLYSNAILSHWFTGSMTTRNAWKHREFNPTGLRHSLRVIVCKTIVKSILYSN